MYRYTALGDSITAGYSATSPALAYPSRIVHMLRRQRGASMGEVLAEAGWTSRDLDAAVFENPVTPLAHANAVTIWIGGDDLVHAGLAMLQRGNMASARSIIPGTLKRYGLDVGTLVASIRRVSKSRIILCTQYNPFPNSPLAVEAVANLNGVTALVAEKTGCALAPVGEWFAGRQAQLIAGYRNGRLEDVLRGSTAIHPNNQGHAVIARNLFPFIAG